MSKPEKKTSKPEVKIVDIPKDVMNIIDRINAEANENRKRINELEIQGSNILKVLLSAKGFNIQDIESTFIDDNNKIHVTMKKPLEKAK